MKFSRPALMTVFCAAVLTLSLPDLSAQQPPTTDRRVLIDATDLPRKLLHATLTLPIPVDKQAREIALWYPKWVPGSHGPGGAMENLAGLIIEDRHGQVLSWRRSPGEAFRLLVDVPADTDALQLQVRYIANQPSANSMGHDVFGSARLGVINSSAILFYLEGDDIDQVTVATSLRLPSGWQASTALPELAGEALAAEQRSPAVDSSSTVEFDAVTLRTLVDSPIMCGLFRKIFELNDPAIDDAIPPHRLHVFSDQPTAVELDPPLVKRYTAMVTQTQRLMGSSPFDRFEILLAVTNHLPANGLEHARSTLNVLPRSAVASVGRLKGWNRLLIPHEYLHAWCGKYRRPQGMLTSDFHTPQATELLWVYEGLTQYLGELIEARCGLMSEDEFRHRLAVELRLATHQQGRRWRSLADTASASHLLRGGSPAWQRLRGGQDYYMEGMLLWIEIDAILRRQSADQSSLDDFCQRFFAAGPGNQLPKPFNREEVVATLASLVDYDWEGLIRRRVELPQSQFEASVAELLGYRLESRDDAVNIPSSTFRYASGLDASDSIGAQFSSDGTIRDVLLESPADTAKLGPGMRVVGVGERTWSEAALREAIERSAEGETIQLLVANGEQLSQVQLDYHQGWKYLSLVRDPQTSDLLPEMVAPR